MGVITFTISPCQHPLCTCHLTATVRRRKQCWKVICGCGQSGPLGSTKQAAVELWNMSTSSRFGPLVRTVDELLNLDWENTVRIECPEDVDAIGIMNKLQDFRELLDCREFYK